MSSRLPSFSVLTRYQPLTHASIFNTSNENVTIERQSKKIQRWIFGMIIGSAPFLFILICWMFVSLCINNLVRFYQRTKKRHQQKLPKNGIEIILLPIVDV